MENVTEKVDGQVLTLSTPSKDAMCSNSGSNSKQVVAAPTSLNLPSDMAPIIEMVTEDDCSSNQEYQQHSDSINTPKEQLMEFEVQTMDKTVENLLSDENYHKEGQTFKVVTKQVDMCPSATSEGDVSLIALAQENDGNPVIMQQNHLSQEEINVNESVVTTTIESEPKPFECTNIILVTDSTPTGAECQIVETENLEAKISSESSSCENSSQTNSSSIVLKSHGSEEPSSSQWSLHVTNEGESAVSLEENSNSEESEKTVSKTKSNSEETYIAVVKNNENTGLVSVQDSDMQSDEGITAETLIAISILQNSVSPIHSECQESENKVERQVSLEKIVEQPPNSVENSKQTGIEIGVQANDYEIERRSGKVPARRRVIPFKFRDYRNPDLVEQGNDSDSDYCPSDNEVQPPKRRRVISAVGPTGRRPGRPRKVRLEVIQKQTESTANTASSTNTQPEKSVEELPQNGSIAQVMTSTESTPTSEKRTKKSSPSNSSGKNSYTCKICQHAFTQKGNLKVHMRVHTGEKPFLCSVKGCSKRFCNNESLRQHNLTHLGIKPFACEVCENKFSSKVSLQEHMAIHTNTKPHVCHICYVPFRQISCLRRHLITHSTEKPFECISCGQRFSQMVYLKSHSKVHTGEKPFVCDHCKRGFAHQSDLIRHKIIHTGKKPFACHICHAKFSDPSSKRRHVKEHMGAKPYSCHLCKDSFKRAGQLKVHLSSKHSNHIDNIQTGKQTQPGQTLQFAFKDADKLSSIAIDDKSSAYHKKIAQIVEGLTGSEVTHIATPVTVEDVILQEADSVTIEEHGSESQTVAQVVASAMQSARMASITTCNDGQLSAICQATESQEGESGYPNQITTIMEEDIPSLIESTSDGATVITIVSLEDMEQGQEQATTEHSEYTQQLIENAKGDNEQQQFLEVHYEQNEETVKEELATESQTLVESEKSEDTADFVSKPDFSCQEYYDWLSNFTEVCKSLPMPLNPDLFQKISQVHKTLSDVMATPSGVIADKENFRILMNISRDLYCIISEHLTYVLQNLDGEKNTDDH